MRASLEPASRWRHSALCLASYSLSRQTTDPPLHACSPSPLLLYFPDVDDDAPDGVALRAVARGVTDLVHPLAVGLVQKHRAFGHHRIRREFHSLLHYFLIL